MSPRSSTSRFFNADGQNVCVRIKGIDRIYLKPPASQGFEEDAFTVITNRERDTSCDEANKAMAAAAPSFPLLIGQKNPRWRANWPLQ
jgi:hypothetical protein